MTFEEMKMIATHHYNGIAVHQMVSSARLCLDDADSLKLVGKEKDAKKRLLKSLAYSVGILHPDYIMIAKQLENS